VILERRLAAIFCADVVGYARMMNADEEGTLSALSALREEIVDARLAEHNGRIVKLMGDGILAEFGSVVDAVSAAVDIQQNLARRNAGLPDEKRVQFRIGINLGDIVVDGDDIHGDGVNVSSRLEGLAEPGGICVSGKVYDEVRGKRGFDFVDLGDKMVKNIEQPIRVYRIRAGGVDDTAAVETRKSVIARASGARLVIALVAGVAIVVSALSLWLLGPGLDPPGSGQPSIAILRFESISQAPGQVYLVEGLTDDLITDLSKMVGLKVIPRNVSRRIAPDSDPADVADALGVRYALTGNARETKEGFRVNVSVYDARTGLQPWTERFDRSPDGLVDLTGEISAAVVRVVGMAPPAGKTMRSAARDTENAEAKKAFLEGWTSYLQRTPEDFVKAAGQLKLAVAIDPDYARAHSVLAALYWEAYQRYWHRYLHLSPANAAWVEADRHLQKALLHPDSLAHRVNSEMLTRIRRHEEAEKEARLALSEDGNDPFNYLSLAQALTYSGQPSEAENLVREAIKLDPYHPPVFEFVLGLVLFGSDRFEEAAAELEKAAKRNPADHLQLVYLVAAYGHLGHQAAAANALQALNTQRKTVRLPNFSISSTVNDIPYKNRKDLARLQSGLRAAQVPEY
jgi:class 3 adenylate cyclase/TolB-like protein